MPHGRRHWWEYDVSDEFGVQRGTGKHTGVDYRIPEGTPIEAGGPGRVTRVAYDEIGGHQVKVRYASGSEGWFAHLLSVFVHEGDQVDPMTPIGLSGATGTVTGAHLHFEQRDPWGNLIDPRTPQAHAYITSRATPGRGGMHVPSDPPEVGSSVTGPRLGAGGARPEGAQGDFDRAELLNPFQPIADAIDRFGEDVGRGARTAAVSAVLVGVVVVLGYSGIRRTIG